MRLHTYFRSAALMLLTCTVFSQDRQLSKANANFEEYAFIAARKRYLQVVEDGYVSAAIYKKLGDAYYFNAEPEAALKWYEKLTVDYAEETDAVYVFRYVQCLKSVERYQQADEVMEKFSTVIRTGKQSGLFTGTRDFLEFIATQSDKFELRETTLNSEYEEYAPNYDHRGQLVFASSRPASVPGKTVHRWNELPFSDLFFLDEMLLTTPSPHPRRLKGDINTRFHEASATFSKDGSTVYFTRNNYIRGKQGANTEGITLLKLYRATRNGDKWEAVEALPFNSDDYSVAHPALSPDGKKLYFASDMPGSYGMSDLYVVTLHEDGTFGVPENLGSRINTAGRETFPYIGDSGNLYFSGDGHAGLGGLDVFVAIPAAGDGFSTPYNLGRPVNSPKDDFSFIINEHSRTGYMASNRSGGAGRSDIYAFTQTGDLPAGAKEAYAPFEGVFMSAPVFEQQNQFPVQLGRKKEPDPGADLARLLGDTLKLGTAKENQELFEGLFTTAPTFEQQNQFPMQLSKRKPFKAGVNLAELLGIAIYFNSAKADIRPDAARELQRLIEVLKNYPQLKLDIRSHTDSRASAAYNKDLSERRVRNTITYIVKTGGIDASRVTGRGYGETQLLNECKDGVPCSNEKHQRNRRSEFIIVE